MRARRLLLRLALLLLGVPLALGAAEGIVRLLDPYGVSDSLNGTRYWDNLVEFLPESPRLFRHPPNVTLRLRHFDVRTDSRGLRGPERLVPKPGGVKRVVFLGDSVVFGWGVDVEDTFVALAERALRDRTGEAWESVNAGHMFHDSVQELAVLEEVALAYEPDLLLLVFVDNDLVPTREVLRLQERNLQVDSSVSEEARRTARTLARLSRIRPVLPYTHALLQFLYVRSRPSALQGSTEHAQQFGIDLEAGIRAAKAAIARMGEIARERGFVFAVLDLYRTGELEAFCAEEGIPYASIAFSEAETATGVRNSASDAHANPNGHRILAGHILRAIEDLGLLDRVR